MRIYVTLLNKTKVDFVKVRDFKDWMVSYIEAPLTIQRDIYI